MPIVQPGGSVSTLLPMVLFQNVAPGPPNSVLQVAVKNNQQPVWYFTDKIPLQALFVEDGQMERSTFLEVRNKNSLETRLGELKFVLNWEVCTS